VFQRVRSDRTCSESGKKKRGGAVVNVNNIWGNTGHITVNVLAVSPCPYNSRALSPLGRSDHNLVYLRPLYKPAVEQQPVITRTVYGVSPVLFGGDRLGCSL